MSEELDKIIHLLGLPKKHLALLPRDGSRAMTGPLDYIPSFCYVKVMGVGGYARYRVRKFDGTLIDIIGYNEAIDELFIGSFARPMGIFGNPTTIPFAGDITFLAGKKFLSDVFVDNAKKLGWSDAFFYRGSAYVLKTDHTLDASAYKVVGASGASGFFTTLDGKTVTVTKGIITSIV